MSTATPAAQESITIDPAPAGQVPNDAPVPHEWQRITTRAQAAARRNESFRALICQAWAPGLEWFTHNRGYGLRRHQAQFMSVAEAIRATQGWESVLFYIGAPRPATPVAPVQAAPQPVFQNTDPTDRPWTEGAGGLPVPTYQDDELTRIMDGPTVNLGTVGLSTRQTRLLSQHVPQARDLPCHIWSPRDGWWRAPGAGTTPDRNEAVIRSVAQAATSMTTGDICHVLVPVGNSQPPEQGPPKPVRTPIVQLVPAPIIKLLTSYPQNKTFRAQLMAVLGEMPPDEADTWDKVKEWVEMNFPKKQNNPLMPAPRAIQSSVSIRMSRRFMETGRCDYRRSMYGTSMCRLDNNDLMQIITDHYDEENSIDDVISEMVEKLSRQINCSQDGPAETVDHEPNLEDGIENERTDYVKSDLRNMLYAFIRDNCSTEMQEYYGI